MRAVPGHSVLHKSEGLANFGASICKLKRDEVHPGGGELSGVVVFSKLLQKLLGRIMSPSTHFNPIAQTSDGRSYHEVGESKAAADVQEAGGLVHVV